jgi:predicted transcriptional regulator of viral defense system/very-short-patch-repair endonuclease
VVTQSNVPDAISKSRVASVAEWRALGLTTPQFRSLVRSGDLVRVWYGVYATGPAIAWGKANSMTEHTLRVIAARVATGRDMVASHHSAAKIHGLTLYPAAPDLVVLTKPSGCRSSRLKSDGLIVHAAELPREHTVKRFGVPVTTVARTVVDIARNSPFMSGVVTADYALHADSVTPEALAAVCDSCERWPGIRTARRVAEFSDARAESVLESCARVIFEEHGLERPALQVTFQGYDFAYSVDFYWPRYNVIAEADGALKYEDPNRAFEQLKRDQNLRDLGKKVVHFTWRELFGQTATVIDRIRGAWASPSAV